MPSIALWKSSSKLLNLPNELLEQVVAGVTPDDLINAAVSCKTLYRFCQKNGDLKRHLDRQKAYTVLNLGSQGMDPIDLMEKLNEDWRIAYYVKAVHFKCPKTGPLFARRTHGSIRHLMNTTAFTDEAMLALLEPLLLLLPNLARLRFIDFSRQPPGLKELVRRVDPRTVLSKLQVIEFIKSETPTDLQIQLRPNASSFKDAFNPWGFLFSVHTFRAENIIFNDQLANRQFHVTKLELINCSVEVAGLKRFLACCTSLKRFTYDWNSGQWLNGLFDDEGLFFILSSCCKETLEYVRITGELPPIRIMYDECTLRGLHRLTQTHLSLDLFVEVADNWDDWLSLDISDDPTWRFPVTPLHEFLPTSTEEITIDFRKISRKRELDELLDFLVSSKYSRSRLPSLKSVVVESDKLTADEIQRLTEYWQDQGATMDIEFHIQFRSVQV